LTLIITSSPDLLKLMKKLKSQALRLAFFAILFISDLALNLMRWKKRANNEEAETEESCRAIQQQPEGGEHPAALTHRAPAYK